jgi:hypothetical protein
MFDIEDGKTYTIKNVKTGTYAATKGQKRTDPIFSVSDGDQAKAQVFKPSPKT